MWGKEPPQLFHFRGCGNTPTRVGKRSSRSCSGYSRRKHPHACGEKSARIVTPLYLPETPPRVWGKGYRALSISQSPGNTPTRVGKRERVDRVRSAHEKHPHACGEKAAPIGPLSSRIETPPRVWGKVAQKRCPRRPGGKHPHACGEKAMRRHPLAPCKETPPRVWGKVPKFRLVCRPRRNTPTRVGKSPALARSGCCLEKHPHACGEKILKWSVSAPKLETPPRVWGKDFSPGAFQPGGRNTPTRVGKRIGAAAGTGVDKKHPHACGEKVPTTMAMGNVLETPPRVWGKEQGLVVCVRIWHFLLCLCAWGRQVDFFANKLQT